MIKFEHISVFNFENALRGLRNPLNSWDKIDSIYCLPNMCLNCNSKCGCKYNDELDWTPYKIGNNDLDLVLRLINGGSEHRKFLRQIFISVDITAPRYWWTEFDTYKLGTVSNSCSTMHTIHKRDLKLEDFSIESLSDGESEVFLQYQIGLLNCWRRKYVITKDKKYWLKIIQSLPQSFNQKRTITMNYENILNIYKQRKGHKLKEWNDFIEWTYTLPYMKLFLGENETIKG